MGDVRTCGKPCHNARRPTCVCWCCGMFHGEAGREARDAFVDAFGCLNEDPSPAPRQSLLGTARLKIALERRAGELGSLHVREPWHRWVAP